MEIYTVKPNDNIDQIALTYKVPVDSLIYINQMVSVSYTHLTLPTNSRV